MMGIVREVVYVPWLCRLGIHWWQCLIDYYLPLVLASDEEQKVREQLRRNCQLGPVHVHVCRRCRQMKLKGDVAVTRRVSKCF